MKIIQSLQDDGISPRAQIRLLDNTFLRLVFSFSGSSCRHPFRDLDLFTGGKSVAD